MKHVSPYRACREAHSRKTKKPHKTEAQTRTALPSMRSGAVDAKAEVGVEKPVTPQPPATPMSFSSPGGPCFSPASTHLSGVRGHLPTKSGSRPNAREEAWCLLGRTLTLEAADSSWARVVGSAFTLRN